MNDGTSRLARLAWPAQGGVATNQQGPGREGQSHIETLLAPGDWLLTRLQDGKQYNTIHKFISKDGKQMWMLYTANFSLDTDGKGWAQNPPGSHYGICFQKIQLMSVK